MQNTHHWANTHSRFSLHVVGAFELRSLGTDGGLEGLKHSVLNHGTYIRTYSVGKLSDSNLSEQRYVHGKIIIRNSGSHSDCEPDDLLYMKQQAGALNRVCHGNG
jgi:hypothetical protein